MELAILGGTGPEGSGLGLRWAAAGHKVIIGSRQAEKGMRVASELKELLPQGNISGSDNLSAVRAADIAVLAVPYSAQENTLNHVSLALSGKLLVTVVAPTSTPKSRAWRLPSGLSAAEEAQETVGQDVRVVAAFQNIGAHNLKDLDYEMDCDVLVCGNNKEDKKIVFDLCSDAGFRGVNCGALQNATVAEGFVSLLIAVNIIYKIKDAGIRITGI
jgi:NADPH-dependent F420 reductase